MIDADVRLLFCSYELMRKCWQLDPADRPTFTECSQHIHISFVDDAPLCSVSSLRDSIFISDILFIIVCECRSPEIGPRQSL